MYSILISFGAALAVLLLWALLLIPGSWGWGIFFGLVTLIAVWIVLARRMRRRIEPGFKQMQRQVEAGLIQPAIESLEAMLPLGRWMPMLTGQIYAQIGQLAYHSGDRQKAIAMLSKSSKRVSDAQMLLASIHYKEGDQGAAFGVMDKAIAHNKKNVMLYHVYAWMLNKSGDTGAAMAVLGRHLKKDKNSRVSNENLLRLQNGNKLNMGQFGMPWYALGFEHPPQSMGQMQQARKGFRQAPQSKAKQKSKPKKKKKR